jgi:hypothetical protein
MTYSSGGLIQASDYNTFATSINTLWGTGSGQSGYGQTSTLASVSTAVAVASTEWSSAIARVNSMRNHQSGTSYTPVDGSPTSGGIIKYLSDFNTTITTCQTNKLLAATNGTDSSATNYDNATVWQTSATREVTCTFSSGDAARYFFNAGGKILVSYSLTSPTTTKATNWQTLCSQMGTALFGATTLTRTGNSGASPTVNLSTSGYYNLTTSYVTWLQQYNNSGTADYNSNYIQLQFKSNGVQGSNADVGSVVSIKTIFTDAAADTFNDTIGGTLRMSIVIRPPESTYLTVNSWGTPTLASVTNTQS